VYNPSNESPPPSYNARYRDSWGTSLAFEKGFTYRSVTGMASLTISNILGRKSVSTYGMSATEVADYLKSLHFPIDNLAIETDKGNDRYGDYPDYAVIPQHDAWANFLGGGRSYSVALRLLF